MANQLKTIATTLLFSGITTVSFQAQAADCWKGVCVVESGDTLYSIAKQMDTSWEELMDNNNIADPANLDVGKKLRLGESSSDGEANISDNDAGDDSDSSWKANSTNQDTYTIEKGDTLFSIMRETGVNWKTLAEANDISAPYNLQSGRTINIPSEE